MENLGQATYPSKFLSIILFRIGLIFLLGWFFVVFLKAQTMNNDNSQANYESVTFGAGCFWCVEAVFDRVKGIVEVQSGYCGGKIKNPSYKEICTGTTGHAEVCKLTYDPAIIDFSALLEIFWKTHNPTTLNRQGNDVGTQYRSVIFYNNEKQKDVAVEMKNRLDAEEIWDSPIVTEILPSEVFYPAEDYHEDYYSKNPNQSYCNFVITPKVEKFEKIFKEYLQ